MQDFSSQPPGDDPPDAGGELPADSNAIEVGDATVDGGALEVGDAPKVDGTLALGEPAAPDTAAVVARGLTKRYGTLTAVDGLDLELERGEIFGLLGPNGAGKTTTILMLLGLTEPTAGTARVEGHDPLREPLKVKSRVGYLPDNVGFYPNLTGRQNLRYTARLNRLPRGETEARITDLLALTGLADAADRPAGTYSRGMRQRLGIADALIKDPHVLILDEPTIGIDPEGTRELLALIHSLSRDKGMTVLLSSHLLHQVQEICDRVGIFVAGRLVAVGPVEELGRRLAASDGTEIELRAQDTRGAAPPAEWMERLTSVDGVREVLRDETGWLVRSEGDVSPALSRVVVDAGYLPVHLRVRAASLDDIYARYFSEEVTRV